MEERRLGFDDMPKLVSSLITEVKTLSIKMDTVCKMVGNAKSTGKKILSIDEVAEMLHKSKSSVYKMVSRHEIPYYKQGNVLSFIEAEIIEWLTQYKHNSTEAMMAKAEEYLNRFTKN